MAGYRQIDEINLAWRENRERLALEGRQILRRVLNKALVQLSQEFHEAIDRGELIELVIGQDELKKRLLSAAKDKLS